jgi:ABC-type bacteriocin/lantibiotic exporter with double-glycine peptidase domain
VGRQNNDVQLIHEVLSNSFNTIVKSIVYSLVVIGYLLYLSPQLTGLLFAGMSGLTLVGGGLRRVTARLNEQYLQEKSRLV